jgi:hypothetical protein
VFEPPEQLLGHCAWSIGESANQLSAIAMVKKPHRNGERLLDLISFFIFFELRWIFPVESVNCPPVRAKPNSSRKMRSSGKGSHSFG